MGNFMEFKDFINEGKDQLDISIQAAGKYLTNSAKIQEFLTSNVEVEHKTDGVKITAVKTEDGWIVAYKGTILYSGEFDFQPKTKIKKESISNAQFRVVLEHFDSMKDASIPVNTELFVEFLMNKPTLSSNYTRKHKMVLIGHSKSKWSAKFGRLKTQPQGFDTSKRDQYAKIMKLDVPQKLFVGVLGNQASFESGIINSKLKAEFNQRKLSIKWDNPELLVDDLRELFLSVESKYGGTEEGCVFIYNDKILKFQQEYQLDQEARKAIKAKYQEDLAVDENQYWKNVQRSAQEIAITINQKLPLPKALEELSGIMKKYKLDFEHSKKTPAMIKEDIQGSAKILVTKRLKGNDNALYFGKFRILTKAHYEIIRKGLQRYDDVVVGLITSKDTKETRDLRYKMLSTAFPQIDIIENPTGNINTLLGKSPKNINIILAGSDRVSSYQEATKMQLGLSVREIPRVDEDISASKVIENINDEKYFKNNTPKAIHSMYNEIKAAYIG
jgi:phosphopantetheine adenylyltransferase